MSTKIDYLRIKPSITPTETFHYGGYSCPRCNGNGGFYMGGYMQKFKADISAPDWELCPICTGTGMLEANIVVSWSAQGEIKEQFKKLEK